MITINGKILNRKQEPIAGASVMMVGGVGSFPEIATFTNENGQFILWCSQPGDYQLRIQVADAPFFEPILVPENINPSEHTLVLPWG